MTISVQPGSVAFNLVQRPAVSLPAVAGATMTFNSTHLVAHGNCSLTGGAGDNPRGYTLGIIQLQWIETNWGYYRGQTNGDGSSLIQRARPPARPHQACRDTMVRGAVLVDNHPGLDRTVATAGSAFPLRMAAQLRDAPRDEYALTRVNSLTGRTNFLQEVQLEFHFCSILTLLDPHGKYHPLKHFTWNVHWQVTCKPSNFAAIAAPWVITPNASSRANSAHVSAIFNGGTTDRRFVGIITTAGAANCNAVATQAENHPNIRESATWTQFNLVH